jgi:hypothetical protein
VVGRARLGARDGQIWISAERDVCDRIEATFAHELGHAFGFSHVARAGSMMWGDPEKWKLSAADAPTALEQHHMALAYARQRGNQDPDIDPEQPVSWRTAVVVD